MERIGTFCGVLSVMLVMVMAMAEPVNRSSSGEIFWSTAKDEADLLYKPQADARHPDDMDGGFSSLDSALQWAIGHSDPAKLKEVAEDVRRLSPSELKQRQLQIKELVEKLKMPSDAQLMQIALDDLANSSLSLEDRHRALQELLELVEPIDNADDLCKLGGIGAIIRELSHSNADVRKMSAWIIGKASQNNPFVQKQILELGALRKLMEMVKSSFVEEATKALYAISALIRNNIAGQELFYAEAGHIMLQDILSNSSIDIRLRRKAVFLIGDLAVCQLENTEKSEMPFLSDFSFLKSVVDLTASTDLDLQEKALVAIKYLLQLRTTEALVFRDFCGLDGTLEKLRKQLEDLMLEEYNREYVMDIEGLRREVEMIFHGKLGKVTKVPT